MKLHAVDRRPPQVGATVVLLHGLPVSCRMFEFQVEALVASGVRCVAFDIRGFGRSAALAGPYDLDAWADDLAEGLRFHSLNDATLVGYSFGGAVAMHYMVRHAQARVAGLVLLAAAGPCLGWRPDNPQGVPPDAYTGLADLARRDLGELNTTVGNLLFHQDPGPEVRQALWEMGMEASPEAAARGIEEVRDRDLRQSLRTITAPTLICHGVHDQIVPWALGAEMQARLIRGSRVVCFEKSGHGLFVEEQERLTAELLRFATGG